MQAHDGCYANFDPFADPRAALWSFPACRSQQAVRAMIPEIALVLGLAAVAVILFATQAFSADLTAIMLMAALLLTGVVTPVEGLAGFSNTATVTIAAMLILSAGLFKTGAVSQLGHRLARMSAANLRVAVLALMVAAGALSMGLSDTAVVALFLPAVMVSARRADVSPSKLLMPLSFGAMFGGACTLIGTSTNILLASIAERHGQPALSMFEFLPVGLVQVGVGVTYMAVLGVRLLPDRRSAGGLAQEFAVGEYLTEVVLLPEAKSVGRSLGDSPLVQDLGLEVLEVIRDGAPRLRWPSSNTVLQANDVLSVRGDAAKVSALLEREGVRVQADRHWRDEDLESEETTLVEAVIAPFSRLEGRTLKELRVRDLFGATALAIRHRNVVMHERLEDVRLSGGDALLVQVNRDRLSQLNEDRAFVLLSEVDAQAYRKDKLILAVLIFAGVVLAAALNLVPIVVSAVTGCVLMVLTRCLTVEEAYEAIEWKVIFLLAGVLTLGVAMEKTGAALLLSKAMIETVGGWGPGAMVAAFYAVTSILTAMMSSKATAALLAPVALSAAEAMGISARPFLMAVAFAASSSFMTPIGYPTNMLVYTPGQYTFADFFRIGVPLTLLFWFLVTVLIPVFWPF